MSELQSEHLICWFCGNGSYIIVIDSNRQILYLKCSRCCEPHFINNGIKLENIKHECKDCHFWEKPAKVRKSYCSENDSYYRADDNCSAWTKRNGVTPSVKPSEASDKQTENENENSGSILGSDSDSSDKT